MKKLLLTIICLLTLSSCLTYQQYTPVTSMSNGNLLDELNSLQSYQMTLERITAYGGSGYTVTHANGFICSNGFRYTNPQTYVTRNSHLIYQLAKVERRIYEIEYELLKKKQSGVHGY